MERQVQKLLNETTSKLSALGRETPQTLDACKCEYFGMVHEITTQFATACGGRNSHGACSTDSLDRLLGPRFFVEDGNVAMLCKSLTSKLGWLSVAKARLSTVSFCVRELYISSRLAAPEQ
jgi:hypothetical protein